MNLKCKKSLVFKISVFLLVIMSVLTLTIGKTFARYITEISKIITFSPQSRSVIYLNLVKAEEKKLIGLSDWQKGVNQMSSSFTFSNAYQQGNQVPQQDIVFRIRAYVADDTAAVQPDNLNQQTESAPIEILLSYGEYVYPSKTEVINEKTDFYKQNQCKGQFYCFYDSVQAQTSNELTFRLAGKKCSETTFTLTVYDTQISTEQIFICVEQIG